jgi:hypothetical protein
VREVVRWVVDESGREADASFQSAAAAIGEFKAQLRDAGVLLRQGLGHGNAARQELVRKVLLGAGREVGRRLEQAQAEALLLPVCLQGGNRAAEFDDLEREAAVELGAGLRSCRRLAG